MALKIFGRRLQEMRTTAAGLKPGELTERNTQVVGMAAKYVRWMLITSATVIVLDYILIGRAAAGSEARETLVSGLIITIIGAAAIGTIFLLFRGAEWAEARAAALDRRPRHDDPEDPPSRDVRRYMEKAVFMIQLGYRLVLFAGLCLIIGVVFAGKGAFQL